MALGALLSSVSAAPLSVLVNPGDQGEQSRWASFSQIRAAVGDALREAKLGEANWVLSTNATADLSSTRAQMHDIYVAPAHVVGSAVRHGYTPLVGDPQAVQAVLVALTSSGLKQWQDTAGKRLGLPLQDSIVTYLLRGEFNAANTSIKRHFGRIQDFRYQEALLICLQLRECDAVGVERAMFERWKAAGEPVSVLMQSKPAPGLAIAIRSSLGADNGRALQAAALRTMGDGGAARPGIGRPAAIDAAGFEYVATLGYFTPRLLPGAKVVDATAVVQLMKGGAVYVDTRNESEFKAGRVPQSRWVPYVEKSAKDTDYDPALDAFDVAKLPADKAAPLILACNGAECWKSYKSSQAAIKAGYTNVHWFRGGLPEWRASGLPLDRD